MRMQSLSGCRDLKRGLSTSNWQHAQVKLFKEIKKRDVLKANHCLLLESCPLCRHLLLLSAFRLNLIFTQLWRWPYLDLYDKQHEYKILLLQRHLVGVLFSLPKHHLLPNLKELGPSVQPNILWSIIRDFETYISWVSGKLPVPLNIF